MALLDIRQLGVSIGDAPILRDVSIQVDAGEILGIAGESGSGKTMTALAVAGLLPQRATKVGEILLDGTDLCGIDEAHYCDIRGKDIGIVFQEPMTALNPLMTIGEQVAETARIHRRASRREALDLARETLNKVELPASRFSLDRYPHNLSGGQRQRVAIAIAMVLEPKLLVADEPTTALDVTTQAGILALFRRLVRDEGIGLVLVAHDLAVIAQTADRVVIMKGGSIVDEGDVGTVFRSSTVPYTRKLLASTAHAPERDSIKGIGDEPILETRNLVREYEGERRLFGKQQDFRAVDDVSFALRRNESIGLAGESGCGKSTLLRTILGLDRAHSGSVRVFGEELPVGNRTAMRRWRRHLQVVFQDPFGTFDPRWRVSQLIGESFHLFDARPTAGEARKKVDAMLEQVGLKPSDADRYPHEFSGGQRQRIAIARALVTEPAIIALDEAVSALDVSIRARILDLLAALSDRLGVSYLFVTHDLTVLRSIADRILVMKDGRIVEEGRTDDVFGSPSHDYTKALLDAAPDLDAALQNRAAEST